MAQIVCPYCNSVNPVSATECVACGAPLETPVKPAVQQVQAIGSAVNLEPSGGQASGSVGSLKGEVSPQDLQKAAQNVDWLYSKALSTYSALWRRLAEAIAIAIASLLLGLIGGLFGIPLWGLLAGILVGAIVGLTTKSYWATMLGAPLGVLLGAGLWLPFWAIGARPGGMLASATVVGLGGALIFRRSGLRLVNPWDWLRPVLGIAGGLVFALIGLVLGIGLQALLASLQKFPGLPF